MTEKSQTFLYKKFYPAMGADAFTSSSFPIIWEVSACAPVYSQYQNTLEPWEIERIERNRNAQARDCFLCGHVALKMLLSHYSGISPADIHLTANSHGKLMWNAPQNHHNLHFNISHCEDIILIAITRDTEIGIDIEKIRGEDRQENIARRFFHTSEWDIFRNLPQEERMLYFYRCWTAKEAILKGVGTGLDMAMNAFSLTIPTPIDQELLIHSNDPLFTPWHARNFIPRPGYMACLATRISI